MSSSIEDEELRRRKLEEALEVKSLRRIISAYLKYTSFLYSHILPSIGLHPFSWLILDFYFFYYYFVIAVFSLLPRLMLMLCL